MKQVILVRQDLKLPKGKMAAQVAHASIACYRKSGFLKKRLWLGSGMKKIVLKVKDLDELKLFARKAKKSKLVSAAITDAGHTIVEPGTVTCLGMGPDEDDNIDAITGKLKMM